MPKYLVETFYTCTFKIVHKLDELSEKKLSELENNNDGKFELIDVKLNNRKTKAITDKNLTNKIEKFINFSLILFLLLMKFIIYVMNHKNLMKMEQNLLLKAIKNPENLYMILLNR